MLSPVSARAAPIQRESTRSECGRVLALLLLLLLHPLSPAAGGRSRFLLMHPLTTYELPPIA